MVALVINTFATRDILEIQQLKYPHLDPCLSDDKVAFDCCLHWCRLNFRSMDSPRTTNLIGCFFFFSF